MRKKKQTQKQRKAAAENRRLVKFSKHPLFRQDNKTIRYRVEIWRVDDPQIRLHQFPMEYVNGKFISREIVAEIAEHLF
ncbi:MAG TPA: hypothetical protein VKJ65_07210, partial [Phycisphaerae bacterium]|nr:hypothetical protein [Phycisphaerae bacterium]